jgi:hypothetical protein
MGCSGRVSDGAHTGLGQGWGELIGQLVTLGMGARAARCGTLGLPAVSERGRGDISGGQPL